jgi:Domain of unknown function (DUF4351)
LGECVQAYLTLDEEQQSEYQKLIGTEKFAGVKATNQTIYEKGFEVGLQKGRAEINQTVYEKGIEKGIEKGRAEQRVFERQLVLREQLEERFGLLPPKSVSRLAALTLDELVQLGKAIMRAKSLHELGLE